MKRNITHEFLKIVRNVMQGKDMPDHELLALHYLDEGYIDSFQLVELIAVIEQRFNMKFSATELTSVRFRTFEGVLGIIEENVDPKKS
jgi:acyl carrier protein